MAVKKARTSKGKEKAIDDDEEEEGEDDIDGED